MTLDSTSTEAHDAQPPLGSVERATPLFVDLDGTLIATDVFGESMLLALKRPALALRMPGWLLAGRPTLKRRLAREVSPSTSLLPVHADVLEFVEAQRQAGRLVILASATDVVWARQFADHVGLFDDVIATDGELNLKGSQKLAAIQRYCEERGYERFAYIGDARADLPIWRQAAEIYVVEPSPALLASIEPLGKPARTFGARPSRLKAALRVMRPQQWVKNVLLVAPLLLAHKLTDLRGWTAVALAFAALSAVASSVYVLNDLLDIEGDRRHPKKRKRPFASGELPVSWGPPLAASLAFGGFALAGWTLPLRFTLLLGLYLVATLLYSFWLKRKTLVDVLLLASLYTLRIVAGGEATGTPVSEWLMALSLFLFTSLAFAKRYAELTALSSSTEGIARGRGYFVEDVRFIEVIGPASGYLAVLVLALYIHSPDVRAFYPHPRALWLVCPLLLYWVGRLWLCALRRRLDEDPIVFALTDRVSLMVGALVGLVTLVAALPWRW